MMIRHPFAAFALAAFVGTAVLALTTPASPVAAQEETRQLTERVAAVVNDEAVTVYDLEQRFRLTLASANLPDTVETRARMAPQVLRALIDERLEVQEANRIKVHVSDAQINAAMSRLEEQNHLAKGTFEPELRRRGIDPSTLRQQIRAQLSWFAVVRQELVPQIHIGEEEVDARLKELRANFGKPEYLVSDIFLAVDDPRRENDVKALADRLAEQLHDKVPFYGLAAQFSQAGAEVGGDLGWVSSGVIDDALIAAVSVLQPGQTTEPIRLADGYHILELRDKRIAGAGTREATYDLATIDLTTLPSADDAEIKADIARLHQVVAGAGNCDQYETRAPHMPTARFGRIGSLGESEIPKDVLAVVDKLPPGRMSAPITIGHMHRFFVVCSRTEAGNGLPTRDQIRRRLEAEHVDLMARRFLRDLRRAAFVEIRI